MNLMNMQKTTSSYPKLMKQQSNMNLMNLRRLEGVSGAGVPGNPAFGLLGWGSGAFCRNPERSRGISIAILLHKGDTKMNLMNMMNMQKTTSSYPNLMKAKANMNLMNL